MHRRSWGAGHVRICGILLVLVSAAVVSSFGEAEVTGEAVSWGCRRASVYCRAAMVEEIGVIVLRVPVAMLGLG
jgi:hypothetical protein